MSMALKRGLSALWQRGVAPSPARTIAIVCAAGAASTLLAAVFPPSDAAPVGTLWATGVVTVIAAVAIWMIGKRMPVWGLHLAVAMGTVGISIIISQSFTAVGMMVTATAYLWICIYTGFFFSLPAARAHTALIAVAFGVALLIGDAGVPVNGWAFMVISLFVAGETLGRQSARLRHEAHTDPLTGALNRKGLVIAAKRAFSLADRTGIPVTTAMIDLDEFKAVNDSEGHVAGDRLLARFAKAWAEELEPADIFARIGGDEFIVFLVGSSEEEAFRLLDRMRLLSPAPWSGGIAQRRPGENLNSCVASADTALYEAKQGPHAHRVGELAEALG